jgi:hypothetical protein
VNITVNVDNVSLDSVIGEHARYDEDGDYIGTSGKTLADLVAATIATELKKTDEFTTAKKRVFEIRDSEIRERARELVAAAIEQPMHRTDSFGNRVGEPTTLAEVIVAQAHAYLTKRVDDGYRSGGETVLQKACREAIDKALRAELSQVITEEKERVVAAVRAKAAELVTEAVKQGIGR